MLQLVKFSCGCVGTVPVDGKTHKVRRCDHGCLDSGDDLLYAWFPKQADEARAGNGELMTYVPISQPEYATIMEALFQASKAAHNWLRFMQLMEGSKP